MHFVCIINETEYYKKTNYYRPTRRSNKSLKFLAPEDKVHTQLFEIPPNLASITTFFFNLMLIKQHTIKAG